MLAHLGGHSGARLARFGALLADLGAIFGPRLGRLRVRKIPNIFFISLGIFEVLGWPILGPFWG